MHYLYKDASFFRGKTITEIKRVDGPAIDFKTDDGKQWSMFHSQDCCESVDIYQVDGSLESLVNQPLLSAYEESSPTRPDGVPEPEYPGESVTWTTYVFEVADAKVRIVWHGSSNGYYSESVQISEIGG